MAKTHLKAALERVFAEHETGDNKVTPLERLEAITELLYTEALKHGVSDDQVRGGGLSELIVALNETLVPSTTIQGADATTADGGTVEMKNSHIKVKTKLRANFSYDFSKREARESDDHYKERLKQEYLVKGGSHHLLSVLRGATLVKSYHIKGAFMADYLSTWAVTRGLDKSETANAKSLNLGCLPCERCGIYRRIQKLVDASNGYVPSEWTAQRWRDLFTTTVASTCTKCAT